MDFTIWNEDCISGMAERLAEGSVGLCVSSIPFGSLFTYSGKTEDVGNCHDGKDMRGSEFGLHLRFFCEQLIRVLMPGRNACIHIQQLLTTKVQHGVMGRRDFRGAVVDIFEAAGFEWKGEFVIPKDPQAIAQRQKLHCLQFKTGNSRDACHLAPAVNDYVMVFQKPGENPVPVRSLFDPKKNPSGWVTTEEWIAWAHGVWADIDEMDILEGWRGATEEGDEKHVCPLQLEVIRRCVRLYSNPGDLVLDPFSGIGSTGWVTVGGRTKKGLTVESPRRYAGFELKESYHTQSVRNVARATEKPGEKVGQTSIFDVQNIEDGPASPVPVPASIPPDEEMPEDWTRPPGYGYDAEYGAAMVEFGQALQKAGFAAAVETGGRFDETKARRACNALLGLPASDRPKPSPDRWRIARDNTGRLSEFDVAEALASLLGLGDDVPGSVDVPIAEFGDRSDGDRSEEAEEATVPA